MAIKRMEIDGFGQLELNQVAFRRDGRIEAQCALDSTDFETTPAENGMLLGVDNITRTIKKDTTGLPVAINYTAEHMYDDRKFSYIGISQELGFQKPHKQFFLELFDKGEIDATEEILIIGDSINSDIKGGINAGITTCWYNPKKKISDTKADYDIKCLLELKNIL